MAMNHDFDEIRRRIQESLAQAKRQQLRDQFEWPFEPMDAESAAEADADALAYLEEFDRQLEEAKMITVRERIGNPSLPPVEEIPPDLLEEAVDDLLNLLAEENIIIGFLGDWDERSAYRYITEELLDEEMSDIRLEGMFSHFDAATPEYEMQMWTEFFVTDIFGQHREYFLPGLENQALFDRQGKPVTAVEFIQQIEAVWARLPDKTRYDFSPTSVQIDEEEAEVTAVITWRNGEEQKQIESWFRLQPSPYEGWDVVQTSLLEDLLKALSDQNGHGAGG